MVDQESGNYRARRAFIEPEAEPTPPPPPAAAPPPPPQTPAPPRTRPRVPAPDFDDEDAPKPLYRDEYRSSAAHPDEPTAVRPRVNGNGTHASVNGANGSSPGSADEPYAPSSDDTAIRSFTFTPRTRRPGEETTTILARTGSTAHGVDGSGTDDFDDDEERSPIGERARWGLAIGVIAAVVILGLAIGYAVLGLGEERTTAPSPSLTAGSVGPGPTTASEDPVPTAGGPLLTNDMMLTAAQAKPVDDRQTWKESLTQKGVSEDGPVPTCFGTEAADGQPVSQQKILRVLDGNGKNPPKALHDATAYATPEEAATAYTAATKTLGTCAAGGAWIESGRVVRGVGDSAVGAVVAVTSGKATEWHSVLIARTGRVVNVLDASQPGRALAPAGVAEALGAVVAKQCGPASGACADGAGVRNGPPPLGGDEPGFPAVGDLPPVAGSPTLWNAAPSELPQEEFPGSSCENVDWATVPAEQRTTRVYLQPDSGNAFFGVNVIVLTVKDDKAGTDVVERIRKNLETCKDRRLTATVAKPVKVSGPGARGVEVTGYTTTVEQKGTDGSSKFRVGIVRAGTKVAYTFANPQGEFDVTEAQWKTIAVRAGQRATQVN
jgi:hypothetical protein